MKPHPYIKAIRFTPAPKTINPANGARMLAEKGWHAKATEARALPVEPTTAAANHTITDRLTVWAPQLPRRVA